VQVEGSTLFFSLSILIRVFIAFGESAMTPACYTLAAQQVGENHQVRRITISSNFFGLTRVLFERATILFSV
jgi:hypothetical protein